MEMDDDMTGQDRTGSARAKKKGTAKREEKFFNNK